MQVFFPPGTLPLRDAVHRAAEAWYPEEMRRGDLSAQESELLGEFALASFIRDTDRTEDEERILQTDQALIASLQRRYDDSRSLHLVLTWQRFVGLLFQGILGVHFVDQDTGEIRNVPSRFWGSKHGFPSYRPDPDRISDPWILSFPVGIDQNSVWREGAPFINPRELDVVVANYAAPLEHPGSHEAKQNAGERFNSDVAPRDEYLGKGQPLRRNKQRTRPQRSSAKTIIDELYPDGVPPPEELSNKRLSAEVNKRRPRLNELSLDTILRAAGRRR